MKKSLFQTSFRFEPVLLPLALALKLAASCSSYAAQGQASLTHTPTPALAPLVAPRAVFATNLVQGRDPFFPDSTRVAVTRLPANGTNQAGHANGLLAQLVLKGVSVGKERRLALINNATFAPGEKAVVRVNNQAVMVQCLEIRDDAVLVCLEGGKEVRTLQLRKGI
jgi:hypothetical protein